MRNEFVAVCVLLLVLLLLLPNIWAAKRKLYRFSEFPIRIFRIVFVVTKIESGDDEKEMSNGSVQIISIFSESQRNRTPE